MSSALLPGLLADGVRALHFAFIFFVVGGLILVVVGNLRGWAWVNGFWLRAAHLGAIAFVVAESWFDMPCPLTTLEAWLRPSEEAAVQAQGFIAYWFQRLFDYQVPPWVYRVTDSSIGLLTLVAWRVFPPRRRRSASTSEG
jgi:hypothetical protein